MRDRNGGAGREYRIAVSRGQQQGCLRPEALVSGIATGLTLCDSAKAAGGC